jgi:hypothetical protein
MSVPNSFENCYDAYDVPQLQQLKVLWEGSEPLQVCSYQTGCICVSVDILGYST